MERIISKMLQDYEAGKLTRRQLIAGLAACASGTQLTAAKESTFSGVGLNHIATSPSTCSRHPDIPSPDWDAADQDFLASRKPSYAR